LDIDVANSMFERIKASRDPSGTKRPQE